MLQKSAWPLSWFEERMLFSKIQDPVSNLSTKVAPSLFFYALVPHCLCFRLSCTTLLSFSLQQLSCVTSMCLLTAIIVGFISHYSIFFQHYTSTVFTMQLCLLIQYGARITYLYSISVWCHNDVLGYPETKQSVIQSDQSSNWPISPDKNLNLEFGRNLSYISRISHVFSSLKGVVL